jgi:hypothetical protein
MGWLCLTAWPLFALHLAATNASLFQVTIVYKAMGKFVDFAFIFFGAVLGLTQGKRSL